MAASYTYEVRCQGEIVSTGTLVLDRQPNPGDLVELGALTGTVDAIITLADHTRLIIDSNSSR